MSTIINAATATINASAINAEGLASASAAGKKTEDSRVVAARTRLLLKYMMLDLEGATTGMHWRLR